jgi:molybdenum cofactor cytidylyltransferase
MTMALIPAAGKSTRMGRPKLSLPLGNKTVLEIVINAFQQAGVERILVVVGPDDGELTRLATVAGAHVYSLDHETPDMRATVAEGLRWLEERYHPVESETWFLSPADHPTLDAETIRQVMRTGQENPDSSIIIPTWQGKRGHPALISWRNVAAIRAIPAGLGLNTYFREHTAESVEAPVGNEEILRDLDTPADYQRLVRKLG